MKLYELVLCFCAFILAFQCAKAQDDCKVNGKVVYCYYESWAYYREDLAHYNVSMIDPFLCSHIIFAFAGLDLTGQIASLDWNYDIGLGGYRDFVALKEKRSCLKTILAVGGWNEGSRKYSVMASDQDSIDKFADSVLRYIAAYGFDGFDVDWEYPTGRGGIAADKENFITLLRTLKTKFEPYNISLTVAVGALSSLVGTSYDAAQIGGIVDYILLMAYDYTSNYDSVTGLIAPLRSCEQANSEETIDKTVNLWIAGGAPSEKLVLGIPAYARTFNLTSSANNGIGAPSEGSGVAGYYTKEKGFLNYYELLEHLESGFFSITELNECANCYASLGNDWFTFDSLSTIRSKVQYAKENNLGGLMVWSVDDDDFLGKFSDGKYPVLNTINDELKK